jgi:hypothetical protein
MKKCENNNIKMTLQGDGVLHKLFRPIRIENENAISRLGVYPLLKKNKL